MKLISLYEFKSYIDNLKITRSIKLIQLHHTYSPSYQHFNGSNHMKLQESMRSYHISTKGWSDIGQHFTIFPDGKICTGRDINSSPAGITGANSGAICIECLGNFDEGGDTMTSKQADAIVGAVKVLLERFNLNASKHITYHAWWTSGGKSLGDYVKGKSSKTCPGTNFFGGNTKGAFKSNLLPLINKYDVNETTVITDEITEIDDIIEILFKSKVLTEIDLWTSKCTKDKDIYWLCRKMANKLDDLGVVETSYQVKVIDDELNYRKGPGASYDIVGTIRDKGIYTIVNEENGWGQLKSLVGWINLKYTEKL